jgi:hypothetical protein
MDLKGFLEDNRKDIIPTDPLSKKLLYKVTIGGGHFVLIKAECSRPSDFESCSVVEISKDFFKGDNDSELTDIKELYFLYKDETGSVYNQNPIFFQNILAMNPLPETPSPTGLPTTGVIDYSIKNSSNLCSMEAVCGLLAAYPDAMLSFFMKEQQMALETDKFREKIKLSGVSTKTLPDALPTFLESLEVEYKILTDKKDDNGFIEYLPGYYPYKTECSYMYSIQNIIPKLFYEKEKCLTLNHKATMYLKEDVMNKLYLYNKEKTEKFIDGNVISIADDKKLSLFGTEAELLPSLDFVKISDDKKYCLLTLIRDDLELISPGTSKKILSDIFSDFIKSKIPGVIPNDVEILGGVGEHYLDAEGNIFGQHIIFFVCSPEKANIIIGDSKNTVTEGSHFLRPRMLLLSLKSSTLATASTSRKTLKKSSRGFHKTKRVRFQE